LKLFSDKILISLFFSSSQDDPGTFFTQSECLKILDNILSSLHSENIKVPGTDFTLHQFDPISNIK
jgi:hypothetical protein